MPDDKTRKEMVEQSSVVKSFLNFNKYDKNLLLECIVKDTTDFSPANMNGLLDAIKKDAKKIPRSHSVKKYIKDFRKTHNICSASNEVQSKKNLRQSNANISMDDSGISLASRTR